jgi:hypothetical protein
MKARFVVSCFLPIVGLLTLSACEPGTSTPGATLSSAAQAIQNNKLADFQKLLTGDALAEYGNDTGFLVLKQELAGYSKLRSDQPKLVSSQQGDEGDGQFGDVLRVYSVGVYGTSANGAEKQIYSAELSCKVWAQIYTPPQQCTIAPGGGESCFSPAPEINQYQDCSIDELKTLN